jgi:CRP-like cAMP-binding protein
MFVGLCPHIYHSNTSPRIISLTRFSPSASHSLASLHKWDLLILFLVLWNVLLLPTNLAFNIERGIWWTFLNAAIDCVFLVDIGIHFFTPFVDSRDGMRYVTTRGDIAQHYLRGWFVIDALSSIPFELVYFFIQVGQVRQRGAVDDDGNGLVNTLKIVRLLKTIRILRLARVAKKLSGRGLGEFVNSWRLGRLILVFMLFSHFLGCMFFFVSTFDHAEPQMTWAWSDGIHPLQHDGGTTSSSAVGHMYIVSFYNALLMLLGESVNPRTDSEVFFVIVAMLFGAALHAALFGQVALLIANYNRAGSRYQEKMDGVLEHTKNLALDVELRERIQEYFEFEWQLNRCLDRNEFIATLSPALQDEVCVVVTGDMVRRVPFMSQLEDLCLIELVKALITTLHLKDDYVLHEGRLGAEMYFIRKGRLAVLRGGAQLAVTSTRSILKGKTGKKGKVGIKAIQSMKSFRESKDGQDGDTDSGAKPRRGKRRSSLCLVGRYVEGVSQDFNPIFFLESGNFFGEISMLLDRQRRTATIRARTNCDLLMLRRDDFMTILDEFPDSKELVNRTVQARFGSTPAVESIVRKSTRRLRQRDCSPMSSPVPSRESSSSNVLAPSQMSSKVPLRECSSSYVTDAADRGYSPSSKDGSTSSQRVGRLSSKRVSAATLIARKSDRVRQATNSVQAQATNRSTSIIATSKSARMSQTPSLGQGRGEASEEDGEDREEEKGGDGNHYDQGNAKKDEGEWATYETKEDTGKYNAGVGGGAVDHGGRDSSERVLVSTAAPAVAAGEQVIIQDMLARMCTMHETLAAQLAAVGSHLTEGTQQLNRRMLALEQVVERNGVSSSNERVKENNERSEKHVSLVAQLSAENESLQREMAGMRHSLGAIVDGNLAAKDAVYGNNAWTNNDAEGREGGSVLDKVRNRGKSGGGETDHDDGRTESGQTKEDGGVTYPNAVQERHLLDQIAGDPQAVSNRMLSTSNSRSSSSSSIFSIHSGSSGGRSSHEGKERTRNLRATLQHTLQPDSGEATDDAMPSPPSIVVSTSSENPESGSGRWGAADHRRVDTAYGGEPKQGRELSPSRHAIDGDARLEAKLLENADVEKFEAKLQHRNTPSSPSTPSPRRYPSAPRQERPLSVGRNKVRGERIPSGTPGEDDSVSLRGM